MISNTYIISLDEYESKRNTSIDRKLRILSKSYTINNLDINLDTKTLTFNRTLKDEVDNTKYYGFYSEVIVGNDMHLTVSIRNLLPKNYNNSIKVVFPELHSFVKDKEEPLNLIHINSREVFNWTCDDGHSFEMSVYNRIERETTGDACPICNSLEIKYPKILGKFDYKNNILTPIEIRYNSNNKYFWICDRCSCSSEYNIKQIINDKYVCNKCKASGSSAIERRIFFYISYVFGQSTLNNYRLLPIGRKSVDIYIPSKNIAIEYDGVYWHKNKKKNDTDKTEELENNGIELIRIREQGLFNIRNTDITYDFTNKENGFVNLMNDVFDRIANLTTLSSIQQCKLQELIDVKFSENLVPNDFYYYPLKTQSLGVMHTLISREWSNNNSITPMQVSPTSTFKALWLCSCGCEYPMTVSTRVRAHDNPCPSCKVGDKSFEHHYPDLAKYWSPKNLLPPTAVLNSTSSIEKYKFNCKDCGDEFDVKLSYIRNVNYCICNNCYEKLSIEYGLPVWNEAASLLTGRPGAITIRNNNNKEYKESEAEFQLMYQNSMEMDELTCKIKLEDHMINNDNIIKYIFQGEEYYDFSTLSIITGIPNTNLHRILKTKSITVLEYKNFKLYPAHVLEELKNSIDGKSYSKSKNFNAPTSIGFNRDRLFIKKDVLDVKKLILRADIEISHLVESGSEKDRERVKDIINDLRSSINDLEQKVDHSELSSPFRSNRNKKSDNVVVDEKYEPNYPEGTVNFGTWSAEDLRFISINYPIYGADYCAEKLCRSYDSVISKAGKMGLKKISKIKLSKDKIKVVDRIVVKVTKKKRNSEDINKINDNIKKANNVNIATINNSKYTPNYPQGTVISGVWSRDDEKFLIDNYSLKNRRYFEIMLCRNSSSVQKKINNLRLFKSNKKQIITAK